MNQDKANERINTHLAAWSGELPTTVDHRTILGDLPFEGFAVFAADVLEETLNELECGDYEVAHDLAYSIEQEGSIVVEPVTPEHCAEWIKENESKLIEAISKAIGGAQ